ncbi:hypothetical protein O6H91_18G039900 [Diphasiastrum complanatum]|uniref:Uncharacterized protein n=2 Tax=Diphasiastrum complanatum TaxID=34168 RepID=A0ACC2B063_DIPCM|nr:hypothetical protein O6H91_18G039900 [Diphasiastrum complanatum]KAJ7523161.1 hypothetical protein O6H91_18G039900 [Diphasiastrum complanatum]
MGVVERSREVMAVMALHEALRNVCLNSEWNYAIFWTIRPRPRSRGGVGSKAGEEGSLMLMWEDGYCQPMSCLNSVNHMETFHEVEEGVGRANGNTKPVDDGEEEDPIKRAFRKMSIQLYNYGEGLMGKVASDKCHKWVFRESPDSEAGPMNYWQSSFDSHPPEWMDQFSSGIQTIAVIQAGHGLLQLGSCKIVAEDLHFVLRMRYTFESLESHSGSFLSQSFAPMRSRFFSGSSGASPSCWPLGHNTLSFLQGSDCKLRLGMPNDTSNQELLLQRSYDQLPSPRYNDATPSVIAEKTANYIVRNSDDASDNSQGFAASAGLKRLSGSALSSRRPPPFARDRSSQGITSLKPSLASPERSTQNFLLETSSSPSFPSSMFLPPSNASSAPMSNLDVYHVQLPQVSETLVESMTMTTTPSPVPWSISMSASLDQANSEFKEKPKSPGSNPHPKIPSFSDASAEQSKLGQLSEKSHPAATKNCNWASQAAPDNDVGLPVWDHLKVAALETPEGTGLSARMSSQCGSGDIYSFMESLFD